MANLARFRLLPRNRCAGDQYKRQDETSALSLLPGFFSQVRQLALAFDQLGFLSQTSDIPGKKEKSLPAR